MKLQSKLLFAFGSVLIATFILVEIIGYRQTHEQMLANLRQDALDIRGVLMATRRVYHHQFINSGLPLNKKTLGFLPAHAMNRISNDFRNWSDSGLSFNNVSDRPRNPDNQADEIELEAMAWFRANPKEKERLASFKNSQGQSYFHFSSPIWTEEYCLKCHGKRDEAPQTIRETYAASYDYQLGDLRGLMSIKLPAHFIEDEVLAQRITEMWGHLFAFAFAFGAWLLRRWVTRRLTLIQSVAGDLARGDYDARVPVQGHDELCDLASAFNDMAEQRRTAESSRRESEQQVRDLLDSTAEAIYGLDAKGRCTIVNPACLRMLGYQHAGELVGKEMHPMMHHTKADGTAHSLDECLIASAWRDGQATLTAKDIFWRRDGSSFPVEFSAYPIRRDGEVVGAVATFLDITERLKSEESLRRAQKMEAVGQLTGGIAHDFNNLLGIMLGNLDFLQQLVADNKKASERVQTTTKAAMRAADLTKQLLGFSRRESKNITATDLNQVIRGMGSLIARSVTPEVEVELQLAEGLWLTEIDLGDLQDALLNLVLNARDAMPNGGSLIIETANRVLDAIYEEQNPIADKGDYVQLAVSDSGSGIPAEALEHIFEPFFTTKSEGRGTGLGLSMVYGFVQRSKGYIKAYSEPGIGTTIHLYLARSGEQSQKSAHSTGNEALPRGTESILVVDDEADLVEIASNHLESLGYQRVVAGSGWQALQILDETRQIDLLFSDVVMPGMSGYELAQQATANNPKLKVLLASGFTKKAVAQNGQARFSASLLSKPYGKAELARRVREAFDD
ncbi:MAG: histidine kinase [endosymbiont of Seepiophila jonesi]|uniref:histidine kinase n=1 Tax=endosymbiont of Lamellibrachia luymesi TaxID=2200907 RepID=A0A370E1H0_9GAMM|nr:MAG: histidine kinase [endosymbiont of Seepiophila jonesi]RDH93451.1 MAG: histidine kinase [endosymbiont of Lamellibrachia luymesi]